MRIINSMEAIDNLKNESISCAISIGKFDGIHAGHRALLKEILKRKDQGLSATVFTFLPSPEELFRGKHLPAIDTIVEKREGFLKMGVDILIEYPLSYETASISPELFIKEILLEDLHAKYVVSGPDLSFGDRGRGNGDLLKKFAEENNFCYEVIDKIIIHETEVSSTVIRKAIEEGKIEFANELLQRNYQITGVVEKGQQLGRKINLPTINITADPQKLLPKKGVYVSRTLINNKWYYGISNVGSKPTIKENDIVNVETHLYDVDMNLYGTCVRTEFLHFVRAEKKFENIDELAEQMLADSEYGRSYLK